uniref:Methyltransferase n=1 Tax=Thelazia callipaeda TaxID=103827 RepID=A0A0N5CTG7_THECL
LLFEKVNLNICRIIIYFCLKFLKKLLDASVTYGPVLTKLSRCGWRVQLFHPEKASKDFTDYGDANCTIERVLGTPIDDYTSVTYFPNTVYFLVNHIVNGETLGFLSNITEQYESNLVYFNEKVGEAVVELKAFDMERLG